MMSKKSITYFYYSLWKLYWKDTSLKVGYQNYITIQDAMMNIHMGKIFEDS